MILAAAAVVLCMGAEDREAARTLMLDGVDAALKQQTAKLFENRLKDREVEPDRIVRGMRNALHAYKQSRAALLKWSPPTCKE